MINSPTEVPHIGITEFKPVSVPIDAIAQKFSTAILITSAVIGVAGFVILLIKRKMRDVDKAIFLTGAGYFGLGIMLFILGSRSIVIAFIPFSLGVAYLFESRFRPYLISFFLVLLILFSFIPLHLSFMNDIQFQTREAYIAENFFINCYNWEKPSFILANLRVTTYLVSKLSVETYFSTDPRTVKQADTIFYTVGLGRDFLGENYTMERLFQEERLNVIYDNSFSYIAIKAQP
jgi:hypothetical protein